jgi:hypothetical protein
MRNPRAETRAHKPQTKVIRAGKVQAVTGAPVQETTAHPRFNDQAKRRPFMHAIKETRAHEKKHPNYLRVLQGVNIGPDQKEQPAGQVRRLTP